MKTTQRKRFTTNDIEIGIEAGIEWSTPAGACIIKRTNGKDIEVEFMGYALGEYKGVLYFEALCDLNSFINPRYTFTKPLINRLENRQVEF